jgi:ribonuclease J
MRFTKFESKKKHDLKIIAIGGTTDVQKNMFVYEYGNDIIVFDCGIGFPGRDAFGVDLILPDFTYILQNINKVRGLIITHGHEDHFGATPYLLKEVRIPIYCAKIVSEFLKNRLKEKNLLEGTSFNIINPDGPALNLGAFKIDYFRVNHSVPESLGFCINTPQGVVFHVPDYKFDWTPMMDKQFDIPKAMRLAQPGVLAMLSDCLGATADGFTHSEKEIQKTFNDYISQATGQVFVTTMSSNISRIRMVVDASFACGRRVVIGGRSMEQTVETARRLGYMTYPKETFVSVHHCQSVDQSKITYIVAGCYGQQESALGRIARDEHKYIKMRQGSTVIFSADPIPGTVDLVNELIDKLTLSGAEVIYSAVQENLHVSGHGSQGDHILLASLIRPKYHIPIGGTISLMRAYSNNMARLGIHQENVLEMLEGDSVVLSGGNAYKHKEVETHNVYIGSHVDVVSPVVLKDRKVLSEDGIFVAILKFDKEKNSFLDSVQIVSRGFVYMKESKDLILRAEKLILAVIAKHKKKNDWTLIKEEVEQSLYKFFQKATGHTPLILPVIVEA